MENRLQYSPWSFRAPRHAFRPHQCPCCVSGYGKLRDFLHHFVFVSLIFSKTQADHVKQVRLILEHLLEKQLFVKAEKCELQVQTVSFLGFIMVQAQFWADLAKIMAVVEWPEPKSWKEVKRFLGFANFYRRFIKDFSKVISPLTELTSPKQLFLWFPSAQQAFERLKQLFLSAPVLIQADLIRLFVVEVDASDSGVGAILSQQVDGKLHPCAFFSRCLSQVE